MITTFKPGRAQDLVQHGSWFRDAQDRYVLFRGVGFASRSKLPPYLPIMPLDIKKLNKEGVDRFYQELDAVKPELDYLNRLGFTVIRLLVMWKAIEPWPNLNLRQLLPEGVKYLQLIKEVIDALYERGLFVIIDFHQDIAHEVYGGDGFPDWALAIDKKHKRPPPSDLRNSQWESEYSAILPAKYRELVRYTLQSFWRDNLTNTEAGLDNFPVRTHLEKTIAQTVKFFKNLDHGQGHPAIIGYELFNEPHCVGINKVEFESQILPNYYSNVLRNIRSTGDMSSFLFVEPNVDWTYYDIDASLELINFTRTPESLLNVASISSDRVVYAFHYYDPWTFLYSLTLGIPDSMRNKQREWPDIFYRMRGAATSRGLIPFLTEFGGSQDWQFPIGTNLRPTIYQHKQIRAYMDLQFQQVEAKLLNATYWSYDLYNTVENKDNWNLENFSLLGPDRLPRQIDIVARPYPMRSSAEPTLLFFDLETKHCAIILQGLAVDAPTVIFVPQTIHYPAGFEVRATSSGVEWDEENQLLYWLPDESQLLNQIIICPIQAFNKANLPKKVQNILVDTTSQLSIHPTKGTRTY